MAEMPTSETIEAINQRWWAIHRDDKPFRASLPWGSLPLWPLQVTDENGRARYESVGPFCHCDLPVTGIQWWGFMRSADRDRFIEIYGGTPEG